MNPSEVAQIRADLKRQRKVLNFNLQFDSKGGTVELLKQAGEHRSVTAIANYFGTSAQRIYIMLEELTGERYRPARPPKKEANDQVQA